MTVRMFTSETPTRNAAIGAGIGLASNIAYNGAVVLKDAHSACKAEKKKLNETLGASFEKLKQGEIGLAANADSFVKNNQEKLPNVIKNNMPAFAEKLKGMKGLALGAVIISAIGAGIGLAVGAINGKNNQEK